MKNYDLRFKDIPSWMIRDSLIGATRTDTPEISRMKKQIGMRMLVSAGALALIALLFS